MITRTRNLFFTLLLVLISAPASIAVAQDQPGTAEASEAKAGSVQQESPQANPQHTSPQQTTGSAKTGATEGNAAETVDSESVFHQIEMKDISGKKVHFKKYQGKVVLIVNVASKCGFTGQFRPLQQLHKEYQEKGLAVVAFPCNQFGKQEPLTEKQIKKFCHDKFDVEFDIFSKIDVKGSKRKELFTRLTRYDLKPAGKGDIKWNFEKFLVGKDGQPIARFRSNVSPKDKRLVAEIRAALGLPKLKEKQKGSKIDETKKGESK